jgi:hypothetical protein
MSDVSKHSSLRLTPGETHRVVEWLRPDLSALVAEYDAEKYPFDVYEGLVRVFAAPSNVQPNHIDTALRWKYGHWGKPNFPARHKAIAQRVAAKWPTFVTESIKDSRSVFDFWADALRSRTTQPYITVTFLLHLLRPREWPIIDQHTFRTMNHFVGQLRPDWRPKQKPSTMRDLEIYAAFFQQLHHEWQREVGAIRRSELDHALMVKGQRLKATAKSRRRASGSRS